MTLWNGLNNPREGSVNDSYLVHRLDAGQVLISQRSGTIDCFQGGAPKTK